MDGNKFADDLTECYFDKDASWLPKMWTEEVTSYEHTTNACGLFLAKFGEHFHHPHSAMN